MFNSLMKIKTPDSFDELLKLGQSINKDINYINSLISLDFKIPIHKRNFINAKLAIDKVYMNVCYHWPMLNNHKKLDPRGALDFINQEKELLDFAIKQFSNLCKSGDKKLTEYCIIELEVARKLLSKTEIEELIAKGYEADRAGNYIDAIDYFSDAKRKMEKNLEQLYAINSNPSEIRNEQSNLEHLSNLVEYAKCGLYLQKYLSEGDEKNYSVNIVKTSLKSIYSTEAAFETNPELLYLKEDVLIYRNKLANQLSLLKPEWKKINNFFNNTLIQDIMKEIDKSHYEKIVLNENIRLNKVKLSLIYGGYYFSIFIGISVFTAILVSKMSLITGIVTIFLTILAYLLICIFTLRSSGDLSEKNFKNLIISLFKLLGKGYTSKSDRKT